MTEVSLLAHVAQREGTPRFKSHLVVCTRLRCLPSSFLTQVVHFSIFFFFSVFVARQPDGEVVQANQIQAPDHDRTGHPLFAVTQVTRKVKEKRPVLRRSKHVLFVKNL